MPDETPEVVEAPEAEVVETPEASYHALAARLDAEVELLHVMYEGLKVIVDDLTARIYGNG